MYICASILRLCPFLDPVDTPEIDTSVVATHHPTGLQGYFLLCYAEIDKANNNTNTTVSKSATVPAVVSSILFHVGQHPGIRLKS